MYVCVTLLHLMSVDSPFTSMHKKAFYRAWRFFCVIIYSYSYYYEKIKSSASMPTSIATMLITMASLSSLATTSLCHLLSWSFSTNAHVLLVLNWDLKVESKLKLKTSLISREGSATSASTPMVAMWSFFQAQWRAVSESSPVTASGSTLANCYKMKVGEFHPCCSKRVTKGVFPWEATYCSRLLFCMVWRSTCKQNRLNGFYISQTCLAPPQTLELWKEALWTCRLVCSHCKPTSAAGKLISCDSPPCGQPACWTPRWSFQKKQQSRGQSRALLHWLPVGRVWGSKRVWTLRCFQLTHGQEEVEATPNTLLKFWLPEPAEAFLLSIGLPGKLHDRI